MTACVATTTVQLEASRVRYSKADSVPYTSLFKAILSHPTLSPQELGIGSERVRKGVQATPSHVTYLNVTANACLVYVSMLNKRTVVCFSTPPAREHTRQ